MGAKTSGSWYYFYILTKDEHPDDNGSELDIEEVERLVRQFSCDEGANLSSPNRLNTALSAWPGRMNCS